MNEMKKRDLFEFLRVELPTANLGYYPARPHEKHEVTEKEKKAIDNLLVPLFVKGYFKNGINIFGCFYCLLRGIKFISIGLTSRFEINRKWYGETLQPREIEQLTEIFVSRKDRPGKKTLKKVEFHFNDESKFILKGRYTDLLFEKLFIFFDKLGNNNEKNLSWELSVLLYFKGLLKDEIKNEGKSRKRKYLKELSYDEYHDKFVKKICKEIHSFLKRNSTLIPIGNKTSNEELGFIGDFIKLTGLYEFEELQTLRNWIIR